MFSKGEYPVHQLVVDADRVLSGNRVISPVVDSTVGQSGLPASVRRLTSVSDASAVPHSSGLIHSVSTCTYEGLMLTLDICINNLLSGSFQI